MNSKGADYSAPLLLLLFSINTAPVRSGNLDSLHPLYT